MNFNQLTDDCILAIFDRLPLLDLFRTELVCERWRTLHFIACRTRRSLLLLMCTGERDEDPLDAALFSYFTMSPDDNLIDEQTGAVITWAPANLARLHGLPCKLGELNPTKCDYIVRRMPQCTELHVSEIQISTHTIASLLHLILPWSCQLITLKLYLWNDYESRVEMTYHQEEQVTFDLLQLFGTINGMPALRCLLIDTNTYLFTTFGDYRLNLPILAQLEQFYFATAESYQVVLDSLYWYGLPNEVQVSMLCLPCE